MNARPSDAVTCAYCGMVDEDLRPCPMCQRAVCWHPTCRNSAPGSAGGRPGGEAVCATCAGVLPETADNNDDFLENSLCPICDEKIEFVSVVQFVSQLPVNAYRCTRGHLILAADYGNSPIVEGMLSMVPR